MRTTNPNGYRIPWLSTVVLLTALLGASFFATAQDAPPPAPGDPDVKKTETPDTPTPPVVPTEPKTEGEGDEIKPVAVATEESGDLLQRFERSLDAAFAGIVGAIATVLFFNIGGDAFPMPFIVAVLALGSIFFTVWYGFINLRGFKHSISVIAGKYDNPEDEGEISHFRALTSALSATVGLGNIAGVAIAVATGGPGAVFWMMFLAAFGMTAKFHECTLAQMYRKFNEDGTVSGGPMYYLDLGLKSINPGLGGLGKVLAILFAVMCMGGALGGGNMFQANQSFSAIDATFLAPDDYKKVDADDAAKADQKSAAEQAEEAKAKRKAKLYRSAGFGLIMSVMVGVVILGGIQRIGAATSKIVPTMCGLYVVCSLVIVFTNAGKIPDMLGLIFSQAFRPEAAFGGFVGVMVQGFKRAAFSNEAGLGSAAIAHSAAKTDEPAREGMVAMIGPFIDTIVICLMTSMVLLSTGVYEDKDVAGAAMTARAWESLGSGFPAVLSICIVLFAYSTMISWCYYGERAWGYLFGFKTVTIFRLIFVAFVFFGSILNLGSVLDFSDLMILCMAFPNIVGGIILAPMVKRKLTDYWGRYTSGEMKTYAEEQQNQG